MTNTNPTQPKSTYDLAYLAIGAGVPKPIVRAWQIAATRAADAEQVLRWEVSNLAAAAEGVVRNLDRGYGLNPLGELQSRGPRFDVDVADLCARREAAAVLADAIREAWGSTCTGGEDHEPTWPGSVLCPACELAASAQPTQEPAV